MPSDDRTTIALEALRRPRETFDGALVGAIDELRSFLAEQRAPAHERVAQEAARLGSFARGRIDIDRFTKIVGQAAAVTPAALGHIGRVLEMLQAARAQGDGLYTVRVEPGTDLRDTVRDALAVRGRLFNAARHVELLRAGAELGPLDDVLPFSRWHRSERLLAPPLVVEVDAADLIVDGLGEYLDGAVRIVLIVNGRPAPIAPLVRLMTPHTFVMQTSDAAAVSALAEHAGPGIAAVVPEECASFRHDPGRGRRLAQRLSVERMPDAGVPRGVGRSHARRQAEDLEWLTELVQLAELTRPEPQGESEAEVEPGPADQLAGWLLRSARLDSTGSEAM